jgi:hypothetical protein
VPLLPPARVRCPACKMVSAIDLRLLDRHPDAAITKLIPACPPDYAGRNSICRAGAAFANKHRRRNAGRTSSSRARRMIDGPGRREAACWCHRRQSSSASRFTADLAIRFPLTESEINGNRICTGSQNVLSIFEMLKTYVNEKVDNIFS